MTHETSWCLLFSTITSFKNRFECKWFKFNSFSMIEFRIELDPVKTKSMKKSRKTFHTNQNGDGKGWKAPEYQKWHDTTSVWSWLRVIKYFEQSISCSARLLERRFQFMVWIISSYRIWDEMSGANSENLDRTGILPEMSSKSRTKTDSQFHGNYSYKISNCWKI